MNHSNHYDEKYFSWQESIGRFGGWAELPKFSALIEPHHCVVDFGCGGGYLLKELDCKKKLGVEINPAAAAIAATNGVIVAKSASELPDDCADVIISNHALEHTLNPYQELKQLHRVLKPDGKIVVVVPCETIHSKFIEKDINNHLYTWNPMTLGNLLTEAGFCVIDSSPYFHKWPPTKEFIVRFFGRGMFHCISRIYAHIDRRNFQVKCIANKRHCSSNLVS